MSNVRKFPTAEDGVIEGPVFAFDRYDFDEDDVGTISSAKNGPDDLVVILLDDEELTGIAMSKEDAFRLARALTFSAGGI